jgi:hypothetical protein
VSTGRQAINSIGPTSSNEERKGEQPLPPPYPHMRAALPRTEQGDLDTDNRVGEEASP